jgi:hypothetical protein
MCDSTTKRIADALHAPFKAISSDLSKDYGGTMDHLWIDFELIEAHAERLPPWSFRFQKRVGGSRDQLTGLLRPVRENVGHYSIRPDFRELRSVPQDSIVSYVLSLVYASSSVLIGNQKKLRGFDADRFRSEFITTCRHHGYEISVPARAR